MSPHLPPPHRVRPTFHYHGREDDSVAPASDTVSQLIIVGQIVCQHFEAADLLQLLSSRHHHGAKGEIKRYECLGLQYLAPKIRIYCDGFPAHCERARISKAVEAVDQSYFGIFQRGSYVREKIR